ncbi:hypothetical protein H4R24_002796 [Coemansia sp. RSA 988]|nr:hypothetical protein H4R24_002796 [Coemansia sp. RSA 988]
MVYLFGVVRDIFIDIELQQDKIGGKLSVRRDAETKQPSRRIRRRQKANGSGGNLTNNSEDDSGFEAEGYNEQFQMNTVGVINPYAVRPAAFGRLLIVRLPVVLANSALSLVGLRTSTTEALNEDVEESEDVASEEVHRDAVAAAIENIDSPAVAIDKSEAKAKKASKKAAKADARRRRTPIVT